MPSEKARQLDAHSQSVATHCVHPRNAIVLYENENAVEVAVTSCIN